MSRKGSLSGHAQLVEWLKECICTWNRDKKYTIYESLEEIPEISKKFNKVRKDYKYSIDPNLPIDLIYREKKEEVNKKEFHHYTIFLVASTKTIPESLKNTILFYKFYLSRVISSKRLKIVLVTSCDTEKIDERFFLDNGIGLWIFAKGKEIEEVFPAFSLRELMDKQFRELKPKDHSLFFDTYVHDAVRSVGGVRPEQFGKRYIDGKVMGKIFDLENISYRNELFTLMNEHLTEKGDEYEFASEVFSELWQRYIGIHYSDFLKTFEPVLLHVFAETRREGKIYRDHYLHQFQVFLLGLYIVDKLYDRFAEKYRKPEISWLIISSFHDMAYPVQLYDNWSDKFFKEIFGVTKDIAHMDLKSKFVEQSFMNCTNCLIERLCRICGKEELKGNWLAGKNDLLQFFHEKITEAKNHCILSSMSILKIVQDPKYVTQIKIDGMSFKEILEDVFIPSALAIAMHDESVWKELKEKGIFPSPVLRFEDDPLSFLLIFCDNVQEWGRPSRSYIEKDEGKRFYLKDIKFEPQEGFRITIWTPNYKETRNFFKDKKAELEEIEIFLQQRSDIKFSIRLEDKDGKGKDFECTGILCKNRAAV